MLVHGVVPLRVPGLSLLLVHLCKILVSPFLQPIQIPEDAAPRFEVSEDSLVPEV